MTLFIELYGYEAPNFMDLVFGNNRVPKAKNNVARESGHPEGIEGEHTIGIESTKSIC